MTNPVGSTKRISLQVRDQEGTVYTVELMVTERDKTGTLVVLTQDRKIIEKFGLRNLQKSEDGKHLTCRVSGATVTLSLESDKDPPALQVAARYVFPFFDATYHLSRTEQQRFVDWIRDLGIGVQV